jgi:ribosome assembly protein YihI (activator of Der GTPase)
MSKDPAFLFYPNDWLGGTMLFSRLHKGAYMDVLMAQFNHGHMALQDIEILLGVDFNNVWPKLKTKFCQDENGLYFNPRLELEINKRKGYVVSRRQNLNSNSSKNYKKSKTHMAPHMNSHMENENENRNENRNKDEIRKGGVGGKHNLALTVVDKFRQAYFESRNQQYLTPLIEKEISAADKLIQLHLDANPNNNNDEILEALYQYFLKACLIKNQWLYDNMSLPILVGKFNEINQTLRSNVNNRKLSTSEKLTTAERIITALYD